MSNEELMTMVLENIFEHINNAMKEQNTQDKENALANRNEQK